MSTSPPPLPRPGGGRRRLWLGGLGGVVVAGMAVSGWLFFRPGTSEDDPNAPAVLAHLDPDEIPADRRPAAAPKGLVAVLGDDRGRHWGEVRCVAFHPDGKRVFSGGTDGAVRVWDAATLKALDVLPGDDLTVSALAFARGGKLLATAHHGPAPEHAMTVKLWDVGESKIKLLAALPGHAGAGRHTLSFTPDGDFLAACAPKARVKLWALDGKAPEELVELPHDETPFPESGCHAVAFGTDGNTLFTAGDRVTGNQGTWKPSVRHWDLRGRPFRSLADLGNEQGSARHLWFDAKGKRLLVGIDKGQNESRVEYWNLAQPQPNLIGVWNPTPNLGRLTGLTLAPDGSHLMTGGGRGQLWELAGFIPNTAAGRLPFGIADAAFSPDSGLTATAGLDGVVRLWPVAVRPLAQKVALDEAPAGRPDGVAFSPDGTLLALTHPDDKAVRVWQMKPGQPKLWGTVWRPLRVKSVAFSADSKMLLCVDEDIRVIHRYRVGGDLSSPEEQAAQPLGDAGQDGRADLAPGGKLAADKVGQSLQVWNLGGANPALRGTVNLDAIPERGVTGDALVALCFQGERQGKPAWSLRVWDVTEDKPKACGEVDLPDNPVALAVSRKGHRVACATADRGVSVWDCSGDKPAETALARETGDVTALALTPNGKHLAVAVQNRVVLWDAAGKRLHGWQMTGQVTALAFTPDGKHLATANACGSAYVIRLADVLPK